MRDAAGRIQCIVEEKDASAEQKPCAKSTPALSPAQCPSGWLVGRAEERQRPRRYYLTDVIGLAVRDGVTVHGVGAPASWQVAGVNN